MYVSWTAISFSHYNFSELYPEEPLQAQHFELRCRYVDNYIFEGEDIYLLQNYLRYCVLCSDVSVAEPSGHRATVAELLRSAAASQCCAGWSLPSNLK